jgi:UDP-glucose:(heptosyl)LPS alpha-1,3-glucosyltransferase
MRVALIVERFDPAHGGREASTWEIAQLLRQQRCEVSVLCMSAASGKEEPGVRRLGRRGLSRVQRLRNFVRDVRELAARESFDVMHAMMPLPGADVYQPRSGTIPGQLAARRRYRESLRAGWLTAADWPSAHRRYVARLERQTLAEPGTLCLPVSQYIAEEIAFYFRPPVAPDVVFNGVQLATMEPQRVQKHRAELRRRLQIPDGDALLMCIGSENWRKGFDETLAAYAHWQRGRTPTSGATLVFVGCRNLGRFRALARRYGIDRQTRFLRESRPIADVLAGADALMLLSWYDACSRVVLEATRLGVPSITTATNGAAEALRDGAGVVVSSPRSVAEIAAALNELADPERRRRYRQACAAAADGLSMERHVSELLLRYEQICRRRTERRCVALPGHGGTDSEALRAAGELSVSYDGRDRRAA